MKDIFEQLAPAKVHHKGDEGHFRATRLGKGPSSDPMKNKIQEEGAFQKVRVTDFLESSFLFKVH